MPRSTNAGSRARHGRHDGWVGRSVDGGSVGRWAMKARALGYVGVSSPKAKDWLEFGPDVLGMQAVETGTDAGRLRMDDAAHRFTVYPGAPDRLLPLGGDGGDADALEEFAQAGDRRRLPRQRGTEE